MLWFARNHPDTPFLARLLSLLAVAYALSPIDLIPDFIPVLGYLDDLLVIPLLIWVTVRMLPATVIADCRARAETWLAQQRKKPASMAGAVLVILIWVLVVWGAWYWWTSSR